MGNQAKETTLGQVSCALYTPLSVPRAPGTRQWRAQAPWLQNSPNFPKCLWGPEAVRGYFLLPRIGLVLKAGQREFGDSGLYAMDCGWRMCSYLFCVLSLYLYPLYSINRLPSPGKAAHSFRQPGLLAVDQGVTQEEEGWGPGLGMATLGRSWLLNTCHGRRPSPSGDRPPEPGQTR